MYIKQLHLKNIRGYADKKINFSDGINLLVGQNNSGKSTIIKAIYKLQKNYIFSKSDVRKTYEGGEIYVRVAGVSEDEGKIFSVLGKNPASKLPQETKEVDVFLRIASDVNIQDEAYCGPAGNYTFPLPASKESISPLFSFPGLPASENENNFMYPFFSRRRASPITSTRGKDNIYPVYEDLSNLASKIQKIGNPSHPRNKEFVQYCFNILGFGVGIIPGEHSEDKIGIYVSDAAYIPIESMGEGVFNIVGLIVILLTEDKKLFLIEELENDIHPSALKKLLNLIIEKSNRNQFIISTHSNIIVKYLGSVPGSKLFSVSWGLEKKHDYESVLIPTSYIKEEGTATEDRIRILEDLGYDLFDFELHKGYIILEESSAEQLIRELLIPWFVPLLKDKIRTIAAKGADDLGPKFNDLQRLFLFVHTNKPVYQRKAWILADGDEAGIRNVKHLQESFKTWPKNHFINLKKPALEHYYPDRFRERAEEVLLLKDKRRRQAEKIRLLQEVLAWSVQNKESAKEALALSAKELIGILKKIKTGIN